MTTIKQLAYSKYLQPWYRPKWVTKLYKTFVLKPTVVIRYFRSLYETGFDTTKDPEMMWLYRELCYVGDEEIVRRCLYAEIDFRKLVEQFKEEIAEK